MSNRLISKVIPPEGNGVKCPILADFLKKIWTFWIYVKIMEWRG
jgi:hypothetical protein